MANWVSYSNAWDYKHFGVGVTFDNAKAMYSKSAAPGVKIMKSLDRILRGGDDEATKVGALFKAFVECSREETSWSWLGATPCGTPRLLDQHTAQAECQGFAVAMRALMIVAPPFGLGIDPDRCRVETYAPELLGGEKSGFLARHPRGGVMGLRSNVNTPPTTIDDTLFIDCYYFWENHKVLAFNGFFYDPSYGRIYANKAAMSCFKIVGYGIEGEEKPSTLMNWELKAQSDTDGRCYYLCESESNQTPHKLYRTKQSERGTGFEYQGPHPIRHVAGADDDEKRPPTTNTISSDIPF